MEAVGGDGSPLQMSLPDGFDACRWQQWRFRVHPSEVTVALEGESLGTLPLADAVTHVAIAASSAKVALDMARVTAFRE